MEHFILKFVLRWLNYTSLEIRRGCDYMVVRFITTYAISAYSNPAQEWGWGGGVLETTLCDKVCQ